MKQQSDGFKEYKDDQLKGFAKFKAGHFTRKKIDEKADKKSDWVRWNRRRDRVNK